MRLSEIRSISHSLGELSQSITLARREEIVRIRRRDADTAAVELDYKQKAYGVKRRGGGGPYSDSKYRRNW